ncbi:nitrogenase molybdenum-iron protein alpha chain [Acetobacterium paludosum]|uniref:Nitrogenase protein alpha chain n=1 Tax=Acetobacterium paludosum TaxID=52693 RepID=A0A923KWI4_9FIRM|nr:nitrogenase molybdenum-iron protein alpha chain [Acetobacterium paludosum]MBC3888093.1 nitrogenase molybdenum-iron protein alpha chain [Acetobacterium paludosum]
MDSKEKVLDKYSSKVYKNRKEHVITIEEGEPNVIQADTRAIPGIMTNRGCCYAGCKGVVLSPLKDVAIITHGPIGCGFYTWGTRRHKAKGDENTQSFGEYCFSTDMQETDIVFGGEKKLKKAIKEVFEIFKPNCIMICSTCPVGLIGDDIHAVAAEAEELYGIKILAFSCEGYKGVSQSGGHHIANNGLMRSVIGTGDAEPMKYSVNLLGEYNIGGDGWETERILKRIGYNVVSVMTGDGSYAELKNAHTADLNLVQCHRSINYIAEMMKTKYGIDWIKVNFIGLDGIKKSLRDMALFFNDPDLIARTEAVIADEEEEIAEGMAHYKTRLEGKTAAIYVGGSRTHHYINLLKTLGVEVVLAGYEFGHRDDYEGRDVLPSIKRDADSKNVESITVEKDPENFKSILTPERLEELKNAGVHLEEYNGLWSDINDNTVVTDDYNHFETEEFLKLLKPDIFFSGIKDKFLIQKSGVPSRQLHSYDYAGPYAGFRGALNFAKDITMAVYTPAWNLVEAPWKNTPTLEGSLGGTE